MFYIKCLRIAFYTYIPLNLYNFLKKHHNRCTLLFTWDARDETINEGILQHVEQRADKFAQNSLCANFSVPSVPSVSSVPTAVFCSICISCSVPSVYYLFFSIYTICSVPSVLTVLFHMYCLFCSICSIPPSTASHVFVPRKKVFSHNVYHIQFFDGCICAVPESCQFFFLLTSFLKYIHVVVYVLFIVHSYIFTAKQCQL